jgi:hypothetical protein
MQQKFHKGDWVKVVKDLGPGMSHFESNCEAIVIGSYADQYGGEDYHSLTLFIKGRGHESWYIESQLTLIEAARIDLLEQWEKEKAAEIEEKSNLDWIFSHGEEVIKEGYGASIVTLAACFGLTNLWGSHGEGIAWMSNAIGAMNIALPYLIKGDKDGWLENCYRLADEARRKE